MGSNPTLSAIVSAGIQGYPRLPGQAQQQRIKRYSAGNGRKPDSRWFPKPGLGFPHESHRDRPPAGSEQALLWRKGTIQIDTRLRAAHRAPPPDGDPAEARRILDALRGQAVITDVAGAVPSGLRPRVFLARFAAEVSDEMRGQRCSPRTLALYGLVMRRFGGFARERIGREPLVHEATPELVSADRTWVASAPRTRNGSAMVAKRLPTGETADNELDHLRDPHARGAALGRSRA